MKIFCYPIILGLLLATCKHQSDSETKTLPDHIVQDAFAENFADGLYANIQSKFKKEDFDYKLSREQLNLSNPLKAELSVLTRFGTPTLIAIKYNEFSDNSSQPPIEKISGAGYFHEGIDFARKVPSPNPDQVYSPVSGYAIIIYDGKEKQDEYGTAVAIYDESSKAIISVLHINPDKNLSDQQLKYIKKGDLIGEIAKIPEMTGLPDLPENRHLHIGIIDLENKKFVDPSRFVEGYTDTMIPRIEDVVLYDENKNRIKHLTSGKLDLVIKAIDLDSHSKYNQEIAEISVKVIDDNNNTLFSINGCDLRDLWFNQLNLKTPFHVINIAPIFETIDPDASGTNILQSDMFFEYALTNLQIDKNGRCISIEDNNGFFTVDEKIKYLDVEIEIKDHFDNADRKKIRFDRK